ncbi:hypothetical protein H0H81_002361 [Sphagnurus paluster]|uniref:Uncharacterized protein n=1 Tax=Sphagnurus paluster TaxID=117069 RepID=A0A9P7K2X3_9AGAR|nr:hypothetical protein H0H81_002361 [Sphagnurus paluster]
MNHSIFRLPSLSTIQPYCRQHQLKPCLGSIKITDVLDNIDTLFGPCPELNGTQYTGQVITDEELGIPKKRSGHTLSFDELATERRIDYLPLSDEMGGFCLEHVDGAVETVRIGEDIKAVELAVQAVKDGKVHIAHETSVGAISRLARNNYSAKPVFMASTCKKGTWRESLQNIQTVMEGWKCSEYGEQKNGPIFSVASDGDSTRHAALFMMCMHTEITSENPLFPFISGLLGLNRGVSYDNLTMDFDYKHLFKHGMVVKDVCINRDLLTLWLERLPGYNWSETSIHALLNPTDAQDVPRAVKLLLCIVELGSLDKNELDPSEAAEFEALCLLG